MSIILGTDFDVTPYIVQNGISESSQKVTASGTNTVKGAHAVYTVSLQVPTDIKDRISAYISGTFLCTVDGISFTAEMTSFSASVIVEYGELQLWSVSFTVSDIALS